MIKFTERGDEGLAGMRLDCVITDEDSDQIFFEVACTSVFIHAQELRNGVIVRLADLQELVARIEEHRQVETLGKGT